LVSIEVDLLDGKTATFLDPDRPGKSSNTGARATDVERYSYRIGEDKSLTIVKQTVDATHGLGGSWVEVQVKHEDPEFSAYYAPGEWKNVRQLG
jgi:hypothetical protein